MLSVNHHLQAMRPQAGGLGEDVDWETLMCWGHDGVHTSLESVFGMMHNVLRRCLN